MATFSEAKIIEGLLYHLSTLVLSPPMQIAWPNVDFDPPEDGYLRASHIPIDVETFGLSFNEDNTHSGMLQVDVMWPESQGATAPNEKAGAVAAHFTRGTTIRHDGIVIRIDQYPVTAPPIQDPPYYQIPITVSYTVEAANP